MSKRKRRIEMFVDGTIDPNAPSAKNPDDAWYGPEGEIVFYTDQIVTQQDRENSIEVDHNIQEHD